MLLNIVGDVINSLTSEAYISALTLALTIPDICGRAEYGLFDENGKKIGTKDRYVGWYNEYIGKYEHNPNHSCDEVPELNGETVYDLRCSMLHQGNPNIYDSEVQNKTFILEYEDPTNIIFNSWTSTASYRNINQNEKEFLNSTLIVNLNNLCIKLCKTAEAYYKENKEKFDFFDYKIRKVAKKEITDEQKQDILQRMIESLNKDNK